MFLRHAFAKVLARRADKLTAQRLQALADMRFAMADALQNEIWDLQARVQALGR
jgi:hypothetical protein